MLRARRVFPVVVACALVVTAATFASAGASARSPHADKTHKNGGGGGDITNIQHVVVLMQENRSYDNYFGLLHHEGQPKSDREPNRGNPNPIGNGRIHPFIQSSPCETADLDHSWNGTHNEWNGGRMNGFTAANVDPTDPTGSRTMGHYDAGMLPFYYTLANEFSIADRYFASVLSQTFPNRFYLLTGTSFGHIRNDIAVYDQKTIFQSLDEAQPPVSWKIYLASFQVEQLFSYVQQHSDHIKTINDYYADAASGNLPQVSFLESDPFGTGVNSESDEHPPANVQVGERFTHDAITALANGPDWSSSAFFLTYDEHGGFYDHVPPPPAVAPDDIPPMLQPGDVKAGFDHLGIRVPSLVISPYSKPHHVSHVVYDHTSILKFIETRFGLPPLTRRDAAADPMLDMFDFSHRSIPQPNLPDAPIDPAGVATCSALHP